MRLTLDELEAERGDAPEPFELDLGDVVVSLPHPEDLPFESLVNFDSNAPAAVLRTLMGDEAFDSLAGAKDAAGKPRVTLRVMKSVLERYYAHYGLGSPENVVASQPSLIGSARPSKRTSASRKKAKAS